MYGKRITAGATLAAAASILAAGVAYAGPTPTANYQMCGYVYSNSNPAESTVRDIDNPNTALQSDPSPSNGATMRSGVTVEGKLNLLGTTYSTTTDANGGFCLQGDAAMATAVGFGDSVSITKINGSTTGFAVFHSSINNATFNAHKTSSGLSATGFHVKM
ncbi:hypothetical protein [Prescottella agglutinans]|nr:hypothetical protein [Prescottella agglutinans]